jgi:CBS domain containing-hemolysin-like protein
MIAIAAMLLGAVALNAFFSGAETGFYRMTRIRLVMEAVSGDWISRGMLWLANQPTLVLVTCLVGNNLAHSILSLGLVMAADRLSPGGGPTMELLVTAAATPIAFICGDLFPKSLFYQAPNRLMRKATPPLLVGMVLFAPLTIAIWLGSLVLRLFTGEPPQRLQQSLARRELGLLLGEGHEAGILRPVQRTLAQSMLAVAAQPVKNFAAPAPRVPRVTTTMSKSHVLRIGQRHRRTLLPVEDPAKHRRLTGFVRTFDLFLDDSPELPSPRPLVELNENESYLSALSKLPVAEDALGHVTNNAGRTVGFVTGRELRLALFQAM